MSQNEYTWDLSPLYPSAESWEKDLTEIQVILEQIVRRKGTIPVMPKRFLQLCN